ncbi:60S ribosomal protein L18 [Microtus ochrogaster]|uniref:60S ribosomal protein L18 n=1 Tax=Microtus ochrogaster TaxID=79684 RepID=A0A8J6L6D2_MICOH|nr:60S ribosomal protein L18 [Microtus ochrogaster]
MDGEGYPTQNLGSEGSGHGPASAGRASIRKETLGSHGFLSWAAADCTLGSSEQLWRRVLSTGQKDEKMKLPGRENKTAVVVGTVTDDVRIPEVPKLKACALRHFDKAPGIPHSHIKPYVRSTDQKAEHARGRRARLSYKN